MRWLACLVAFFSLGQLLTALALLGPHSDVPGQPFTSVFVMLAALGGLALARALWRQRANLGRGLALWGMGLGAWALGLTLTVASPSERREAVPALALGLAVWAVFIWAAARRLGRTRVVAAVVLMLASVVGARPTAAQEAAPESPACGRPGRPVDHGLGT